MQDKILWVSVPSFTGDRSCVYSYGPETKLQSSQWSLQSTRLKRAPQFRSDTKSMLIVFLNITGWCTVNSSSSVRTLMPGTTVTFWHVWGRTFSANDVDCGRLAAGHLQHAMRQLFETSDFGSAQVSKLQQNCGSPPPLLAGSCSLQSFSVPHNKIWFLGQAVDPSFRSILKSQMRTYQWSQKQV